MRFGPLEIRRAQAAGEQPPTRGLQEKGASGTQNFQGFLSGHEYSRDLRFPDSIRMYDRMRRSDPAVRESLGHIWAPIQNATWQIEPASDDPEDREIAEMIRCAYFEWLDQPFSEYLHQSLLHIAHGYGVFETPTKVVETEIEIELPADDGTEATTRTVSRQWVTWRRFAQRLPETIARWNVQDGELVSVEQWAWKDGAFGQYVIPAEQLLVFVNEREGDDFHGISLLRSAVKPFVIKETVENIMSVAAERHGIGINTTYLPDQYRDDQAMIDRVEQMMRDLNGGDRPYLVFPGPKATAAESGRDGFTFEIVTPTSTIPDLVEFAEYLRGDIKGNVLARFAELGHGSVGARATGDSQSPVWIDALHAVATYVATVNDMAIRRLVDLNYTTTRYPRLVAQDIESKNLEEFANAHAKLLMADGIKADRTYRQFLRRGLGAPDEDEDAEQQLAGNQPDPGDEDGAGFNRDRPQPREPNDPDPQNLMERERLRDRARMAEREADRMVVRAELAEVTAAVRALAEHRQPAGPSTVTNPVVNVQPPDMAVFAEALADRLKLVLVDVAGALAQQSAPTVNVDLAEIHELVDVVTAAAGREQPIPEITVQAADVDFTPVLDRLEQLLRAISEQQPPVVNVTPEITLQQPPARNKKIELRRDSKGELDSALVQEV